MVGKWYDSPTWRRVFFISALGVLTVAVAMASYTLYKPVRAQQLAQEALTLMEKGELLAARDKVMAADVLCPRSLKVVRSVLKVCSRFAPAQMVPLSQYAVELSGGAAQDRQKLALALIATGEIESARDELAKLEEKDPNDPETMLVRVNWLIAASRQVEALDLATRLVESDSDSVDYWKTYSYLATGQGGEELAKYLKRMEKLKAQETNLGLWARGELAKFCDLKELDGCVRDMLRHPLATRDTMLYAYQIRRQRTPITFDEIRKNVSRLFNNSLEAERLQLAYYYRSLGDYDGVLLQISPKTATASKENLLLYIDALEGAKHYAAVLECLTIDKLPLEECWKEVFRARALSGLGKNDEAQTRWEKALAAAGNNGIALGDIANYVMTLGDMEKIEEVMPLLLPVVGSLQRSYYYEGWLKLALGSHDAPRTQKILAKMNAEFPKNTSVKNDFIYYSLLTNQSGEWVAQAYELAKSSPGVVAHRMTLALALLKAGQNERAYEVVNTTRISDWKRMPVGWQLVRAAAFKAAGKEAPPVENVGVAMQEEQGLVK